MRNALAHSGAVIDLQIDGAAADSVVLKERVRHPVSGETMHIDLLRVDLLKPIQTQVALELIDIDDSDVKIGGVLDNSVREVTLEAVPTAIPDVIQHSIAGLEFGGTVTLGEIKPPEGTTIIGDPDLVIAAIRTSRAMLAESGDGVELETEVVGEGGEEGESKAAADGDAAEASADGE